MKTTAGLNAAKNKFETFSQVKKHDIDTVVNPNAPKVISDDWVKPTGWTSHFKRNPKIGDF